MHTQAYAGVFDQFYKKRTETETPFPRTERVVLSVETASYHHPPEAGRS